jgi:hypothetical protein
MLASENVPELPTVHPNEETPKKLILNIDLDGKLKPPTTLDKNVLYHNCTPMLANELTSNNHHPGRFLVGLIARSINTVLEDEKGVAVKICLPSLNNQIDINEILPKGRRISLIGKESSMIYPCTEAKLL